MKILQVMAGAEHGGAETAFVDMCLALQEAGQQIEVATRGNDVRAPRLLEAGLKVHKLPFGGVADLYTPWALTKVVKDFQPDIVQTWMARAAWKMPHWNASMGAPRYLNVARLGGYYKIKYFKSSDYFNTITPDIRRYLIEKCDVAPDHVRHINNFAEVEAPVSSISRSDYGVPEDALLLLGLGRLHTSKGFDTLIRAVAALEGVYLWIAGEGPQRAELERLIEKLNVGDRVRLLGWQSDRAALFEAVNICVFSSRYEPFGTVFVQAWAMETPLITTDADGPRQYVRDGWDGLVVPVDNVEALSGAIKRLIDAPELARALVQNGKQHYQDGFTKEKTVQDYLDYFAEIRARENLPV